MSAEDVLGWFSCGSLLIVTVALIGIGAKRPLHRWRGGEFCANCGRIIQGRETPCVYCDFVVCGTCAYSLQSQPACPHCGLRLPPTKRDRKYGLGRTLKLSGAVLLGIPFIVVLVGFLFGPRIAGSTLLGLIISWIVISLQSLRSRYLHCRHCGALMGDTEPKCMHCGNVLLDGMCVKCGRPQP